MTINQLNLDNFPNIEHYNPFISLTKEIETKLSLFPQTFNRAQGSLRFCWFIIGDEQTLFTPDEDSRNALRESFLRASLAEFVSMEQTLERDLENTGNRNSAIKIYNSSNPLLPMLRELRNLEIHLTSSTLSAKKIELIIQQNNAEQQNIPVLIWYIDNLTPSDFLSTRNAKYYNPTELERAAGHFLDSQKKYGIKELILNGVTSYSEEIINQYNL